MECGGMTLRVDRPPEDPPLETKAAEDQSKLKETNPAAKKIAKNKTKPLYFWNTADVNKWLRKHSGGLHERYGELLSYQEITGRTLIRMTEIKLEKIGISKLEHRRELMQHILRLRLKHEMVDLNNLDQKGTGFELKLPDSKSKYQSIKDKESKDSKEKT